MVSKENLGWLHSLFVFLYIISSLPQVIFNTLCGMVVVWKKHQNYMLFLTHLSPTVFLQVQKLLWKILMVYAYLT